MSNETVEGAREALVQQIAEALRGWWHQPPGAETFWVEAARAVLPLVEAQVAPLRDEVDRLLLILEGGESAEGAMRAVREVVAVAGRAEAAEAVVERLRDERDRLREDLNAVAFQWRQEADAAESALRQVRELADEWKADYPGPGAAWHGTPDEWWRELVAILDSARVGAADTQPEGAGGIVTPAGTTPGGMQVCPDCGRWGSNPAGLCVNNFHDAAHAIPTAGGKVDTAPDAVCCGDHDEDGGRPCNGCPERTRLDEHNESLLRAAALGSSDEGNQS